MKMIRKIAVIMSLRNKLLYYGYSVKNKCYPGDVLLDIPIEKLLG